jgi:hypothetical protein
VSRFSALDDTTVVLVSNGLFRQAKVYERDRYLFAGFSGGFLRLINGGSTSRPNVRWLDHEVKDAEPEFCGWLRLK